MGVGRIDENGSSFSGGLNLKSIKRLGSVPGAGERRSEDIKVESQRYQCKRHRRG